MFHICWIPYRICFKISLLLQYSGASAASYDTHVMIRGGGCVFLIRHHMEKKYILTRHVLRGRPTGSTFIDKEQCYQFIYDRPEGKGGVSGSIFLSIDNLSYFIYSINQTYYQLLFNI